MKYLKKLIQNFKKENKETKVKIQNNQEACPSIINQYEWSEQPYVATLFHQYC